MANNFPVDPGQRVSQQKQGFDFNPTLANTIANANAGAGATGQQGLSDLLANPTANTGFQTTLAGILQSLQSSQQDSRQALADQFKAAGAEQSGAMGTAFSNLEGKFNQQNIQAAGEALKSYLPSAVQGYSDMAKLGGPTLLDALKTAQQMDVANQGNGQGNGGPSNNAGVFYSPTAQGYTVRPVQQTAMNIGSAGNNNNGKFGTGSTLF